MEVINSLDSLFPPFAESVQKIATDIKKQNLYVFETYRSFQRQLELWSQGRQLQNGIWIITDTTKIVTKAKPGASFHAYGLAFDSVPDGNLQKAGIQWSWSDTYIDQNGKQQKIQWDAIGKAAQKYMCEWAGTWKNFPEFPHVQNRYGFKISELYPILTTEGIEAVWKKVMTKVPASPNVVAVVAPVVIPPVVVAKPTPIPVATAEEMDTHTNVNADVNSGLLSLIGEIIKAILSAFAKK